MRNRRRRAGAESVRQQFRRAQRRRRKEVLMRGFVVAFGAVAALTMMMASIVLAADAGRWMSGQKADIAGVSASQHQVWGSNPDHGKIMGVHVVGDYAMDVWSEEHICCPSAVFKRVAGQQWKRLTGSGGDSPIAISDIVSSGVPTSVAHELCSGWPKGYGPCD